MPAGGRFAIEIFRTDTDARATFIGQRESIDADLYDGWLPTNFRTRNVSTFGKLEQRKIFDETLGDNRLAIARTLGDFDAHATAALARLRISQATFDAAFYAATGRNFGDDVFGAAIRYAEQLGDSPLFGTRFFSAALLLCREPPDPNVFRLVNAVVQLLSGALGQDLASRLNASIFAEKPAEMDVLQVGDLFRVDPTEGGEAAFLAVMASKMPIGTPSRDVNSMMRALLLEVLEQIIQLSISYQRLMDEYYPFLFKPSDWAKFTKISTFLHAVHEYVRGQEAAILANFVEDGYYHDIAEALKRGALDVAAIGTANYTKLVERALPDVHDVYHLNGSLDDYLDPYRNRIVPEREVAASSRFLTPLLFTQSGTKPMTSIEMARRYVDFYDRAREADVIAVIGFGFGGDDGHINGLLRHAAEVDRKQIAVLAFDDPTDDEQLVETYRRKLRLETSEMLTVMRVDAERNSGDRTWLEVLLDSHR